MTVLGTVLLPAVTLPVIWRREKPLAATVALGLGIVLSGIPTFDQTRCLVAIPAALLIVFSLGARAERSRAMAGLAVVLAGLGFLLFTDPVLDTGAAVFLPIAAGVWVVGRLTRTRTRLAAELAQRVRDLEQTREATAELAVEIERARLASAVDVELRERIRSVVKVAAMAEHAEMRSEAAFNEIETVARASLNVVRELVGALRSDGHDTSPGPALAQLETLLGRAWAGGGTVALGVEGRPRVLPVAIDRAVCRTIELALETFAATGDGPPGVRLRYLATSLELEVHGSLPDGAPAAALAAARERVTVHGGSFDTVREGADHLLLRARLPTATSDA